MDHSTASLEVFESGLICDPNGRKTPALSRCQRIVLLLVLVFLLTMSRVLVIQPGFSIVALFYRRFFFPHSSLLLLLLVAHESPFLKQMEHNAAPVVYFPKLLNLTVTS